MGRLHDVAGLKLIPAVRQAGRRAAGPLDVDLTEEDREIRARDDERDD